MAALLNHRLVICDECVHSGRNSSKLDDAIANRNQKLLYLDEHKRSGGK